MADSSVPTLELPGCTAEPLMAYLKALGILRLISEQKDCRARGWWRDDVFCLQSVGLFGEAKSDEARREALLTFFLEEYTPTPIVAPWAGGSGFFAKDNRRAVEALCGSSALRCEAYALVLRHVQRIIADEGIGDKPEGDDKTRLIRRYRQELPDNVVAWMDAAMMLQQNGQGFAPLLGTGGNDGRLDFTQNFMQRIVLLGLHREQEPAVQSRSWLAHALFARPARLQVASVGQFAPGRAGGANATHGMEGDASDNPWDFICMLEGALVLGGAAVRRFGAAGWARAAFPFTVRAVAAGYDAPAHADSAESRGELWLPLWTRPASLGELRQLFGEGRAEVCGRRAVNSVDFARAVAGFGVDRGLVKFCRFGLFRRSGKAFIAAPLGRFEVAERTGVDLLREADGWLERLRRATSDGGAPPRFGAALRRVDGAVLDFCKYGGAACFQTVIVALGMAERALADTERLRDAGMPPLAGLSPGWIAAADDGSPEFVLARALAAVHDGERRCGPLRANIEPVDWRRQCRAWAEQTRSLAWNAADLATNLASVLQRRLLDGAQAGCERLPLEASFTVPLDIVAAFLQGTLMDARVGELLWGLMLTDTSHARRTAQRSQAAESAGQPPGRTPVQQPLPRDYALLKLLFLPRPLVVERTGERVRWRLARRAVGGRMEGGLTIRPEPRILALLRAGRIGAACQIAAQRLRVAGLAPMPGPLLTGLSRDATWIGPTDSMHRGRRLAGALLLPLSSKSVGRLVHIVCRDESAAALAVMAEGESE